MSLSNDQCDHDFEFISDYYGDPEVPHGTVDCSRWECKICGDEATPDEADNLRDAELGAQEDATESRIEHLREMRQEQ